MRTCRSRASEMNGLSPDDDIEIALRSTPIRVPGQDAARPEIERWFSAFGARKREFADLLGLYRVECLERDASRQRLIRLL